MQPRSKPVEDPTEPQTPVSSSAPADATEIMSEDAAKKKIDEDIKEFFAIRSLEEAENYFTSLPSAHHTKLVDKLASKAIEAKEADSQLVADLFELVTEKALCSSSALEDGLKFTAEILYDIAIDAPKAPSYFAGWVAAAKLDPAACSRLAAASPDSDNLLALLTES